MGLHLLEYLLDDLGLVLFGVVGGVNNEDVGGGGVDAHELAESVFPHVGHVLEGVVMDL